jgi:hypothetical protein
VSAADVSVPNLWHGVPFHAGDTVLLEWTEDPEKLGRAVWVVPESCATEDPDFAELSDDNEEMGGLGLIINGDENVHPTTLTVLEPDADPISLIGFRKVKLDELNVGDTVIALVRGGTTLTIEHTLTEDSIEGQEYGQLYYFLDFSLDEDDTVFFRKVAS